MLSCVAGSSIACTDEGFRHPKLSVQHACCAVWRHAFTPCMYLLALVRRDKLKPGTPFELILVLNKWLAVCIGKSAPLQAHTMESLSVCSDVHGDMSAIVLSLRWPATSLNQALEMPVHTPPPKSKHRSPEQQAASQRAQHRWGQVKMLHVEFYRARRCTPSPH